VYLLAVSEEEKDEGPGMFWSDVYPSATLCTTVDDLHSNIKRKTFAQRTTASLPFRLAVGLEMAVGVYHLVLEHPKPKSIRLDTATNQPVECRTHYAVATTGEGDQSETAQGEEDAPMPMAGSNGGADAADEMERYEGEIYFTREIGGERVVLSRTDMENLRRFDQPGITVIGFKPLSLLKPSHRMGPSKYIYPIDAVIGGSGDLYRALFEKCLERGVFILARYTLKTNTTPKLVAIVPQGRCPEDKEHLIDFTYVGFHLLTLPFAEDVRSFEERFRPPHGEDQWPSASREQIDATKDFVRKLSRPKFFPDYFANPVLQRHYKAVETIALDLDIEKFLEEADTLDKIEPYFANPSNEKHVAGKLAKFKEVFSIQTTEDVDNEMEEIPKPVLKKGRAKKT